MGFKNIEKYDSDLNISESIEEFKVTDSFASTEVYWRKHLDMKISSFVNQKDIDGREEDYLASWKQSIFESNE